VSNKLLREKRLPPHLVAQVIENRRLSAAAMFRRQIGLRVDVPLHVVGTPAPGTLVTSEATTLSVEVEATAIPPSIEVDVEGAQAGTQIHAGKIPLPEGATLVADPEALVINVADATQPTADELEAEAAAAEAAEGEGAPEQAEGGAAASEDRSGD